MARPARAERRDGRAVSVPAQAVGLWARFGHVVEGVELYERAPNRAPDLDVLCAAEAVIYGRQFASDGYEGVFELGDRYFSTDAHAVCHGPSHRRAPATA